jgi:hypothetical protein
MKKHINKKNTKRNSKKNTRKTSKKGCGCKSNIFFAMKKKIVGGNINPASFQNFQSSQNQYYYDVNTHNNDPNNPSMLTSSRNLPNFSGGKKMRKTQKTTRKNKKGNKSIMRKIKGGNGSIFSFGNYNGASDGTTIFSGNKITNNEIISQPAYQYNSGSYKLLV